MRKGIILLDVVLAAAILIVDVQLPLGVAGGVPYVGVVLLSLWMPNSWYTIATGLITTLLTIVGYYLSPEAGIFWVVAANRLLAIFGIWTAVFFTIQFKGSQVKLVQSEHDLMQLNADLELKIQERTNELNESQELYRAIARNFPNGTINVLDKQLHYVFVEGQELYRMGVTGDKLVGSSYYDRLPPEIRDDIKSKLMNVFDGKDESFEIETKNNFYQLNAVSLRNYLGELDQILVVEQNISKLKKAEQGILEALENEKNVNELKSRFVSMASHEFRTPLSAIMSSVSLVEEYRETKDLPKRQKHIDRIKSSVHNLIGILNDYLSLDKIEAGKAKSNPVDCDIQEIVNEVIDQMRQMAKADQNITYTHKGGNERIYLDKQIMKNILINLLSNAIKYSPASGSIEIITELNESSLKLTVNDKGIGIPEEEQAQLFERFFRAKNSLNIQGTGLGLNIVKKYIDLLDGNITFNSVENEGSSFQVILPLTPKVKSVAI